MLIEAKSIFEIISSKTQLRTEFDIKDLGAKKKILGVKIHRDKHGSCIISKK